MIYADNAATTQLAPEAFDAMRPYFFEDYGNASQLYSFSRKPKQALQKARETVADCIGALPEEIYFTSGGTESDNWALKGSVFLDRQKNEVLTTSIEHHAVLHSCEALERQGVPIRYLIPTNSGYITTAELKTCISKNTRLVSVMFANNEIGTIQPIKELCKITHSCGALFHTDAVQAVGHVPINVHELEVDMLSASAHKFNGPKGVGFLYKKEGANIYPYADGGAQEKQMRAGTENIAGIVGMAVALKKNCERLADHERYLRNLEEQLILSLNSMGIKYRQNGGDPHLPGLLSLSFPSADGEAIMHRMDLLGICISTGSACNSKSTEISHVLKAIKLDDPYARGTIRISLGINNTIEDIDTITKALSSIVH